MLIAASPLSAQQPTFIEQDALGEFFAPGDGPPRSLPGPIVAVADLDADGLMDFVPEDRTELWINAGPQSPLSVLEIPPVLAGTTHEGAVTGDFDGDGFSDLIRGSLEIYLAQTGECRVLEFGTDYVNLIVVDADRDGDLDLFAAALEPPMTPPDGVREVERVDLFTNDGAANFVRSIAIPAPFVLTSVGPARPPGRIQALDLDQSGSIELIVSPRFSFPSPREASVFADSGSGTWVETVLNLPSRPVVGDLDNDGDDEFVVRRDPFSLAFEVWTNTAGVLAMSGIVTPGFPSGAFPPLGRLEDIDGDGFVDLPTFAREGVSFAFGFGDGTFTTASTPIGGRLLPRGFAGDFDGDGVGDFLASGVLGLTPPNSLASPNDVYLGQPNREFLVPGPRNLLADSGQRVSGDFNGDGRTDFAIPLPSLSSASGPFLAIQVEAGTYEFFRGTPLVAPAFSASGIFEDDATAADLDGDGVDELYSVQYLGPDHLVRFELVSGNITNTVIPFSIGPSVFDRVVSIVAANFDSDPQEELALLLKDGTRSFIEIDASGNVVEVAPAFVATIGLPGSETDNSLTPMDFEGDGDVDLVESEFSIESGQTQIAVVHLNNGQGVFTQSIPIDMVPTAVETRVMRPAVIDIEGDGDDDLIFPGLQQLLRNDGGGIFTPLLGSVSPGTLLPYAVADVDNDGDQDLFVVPESDPGSVLLVENLGGGSFLASAEPVYRQPSDSYPVFGLSATDVDGDQDVDLLADSLVALNQGLQIATPFQARVGEIFEWRVDNGLVAGLPGSPNLRVVLVSPTRFSSPLQTVFGRLSLDQPVSILIESSPTALSPSTSVSVIIPNFPALAGSEIFSQALIGVRDLAGTNRFRLSNSLVDTIGF